MKISIIFGGILIMGNSFLFSMPKNTVVAPINLAILQPNQKVAGFYTEAVYSTDDQDILGARFIHKKSGFILDFLRIQTVPQAFIWVNTHPVSDRGEPHTLEHLLLGKGKKGRHVASLEEMSLGKSSAFTAQVRTCYHFHTTAGSSVFFSLFKAKLDAMLHPDFSDEEIRREVRNMGIREDAVDSTLSLEEKGTVYNEMVSGFERPWGNMSFKLGKMLYGNSHPVGFSAGGHPDAIREMVPKHIREFHSSTHHLNNMGAVVILPDDINLDSCLSNLTQILDHLEPDVYPLNIHVDSINDELPLPDTQNEGLLTKTVFPHTNQNEPGVLLFAWPANRQLDTQNDILIDLFLSNFAGGQTSVLYERFIDSNNRIVDIGATAVFAWHSDKIGEPVYIGFNNVSREKGSEEMMDSIRQTILDELLNISEYEDDSDELKKFNQRIEGLIEENKKGIADFLNSPPRFGYRGTGSQWMNHLTLLHNIGGFNRSLSLTKYYDQILEIIRSSKNQWKNLIKKWKLLENKPYGIVTLPDSEYLKKSEVDSDNRIHNFINTLQKQYNTEDQQTTLLRFKEEYDKKTQIIEKDAQSILMPEFIKNPPYGLDNLLNYSTQKMPGGGDLVFSNFDYLSGATLGFAFNLYAVPNSLLLYLPALPALMTDIGVIMEGKNISYNDMQDRLRREILRLEVFFDTNERTNRIELTVEIAGLNTDECRDGLMWTKTILNTPNLHRNNLPRIRDVVDLNLGSQRDRMRGSEESWVMDPAQAFRNQVNPLFLTAGSFLTQKHALLRLRWQLKQSDKNTLEIFTKWMETTAQQAENGREDLISWIEESPPIPKNIDFLANEALQDLEIGLSDIPDESLDQDWRYLCHIITKDLAVSPDQVLDNISFLLKSITHQDNLRSYIISSSNTYLELKEDFFSLVADFSEKPTSLHSYNAPPSITQQMQNRYPHIIKPVYLGLVNNSSSSGVHINTAPCASFMDSDPEILLDFLAARIYGGHGAHSMFMQTWGAGLAYSNGLRSNEYNGNLLYYAERCPDLTQTMQFVIQTLNRAPYDTALAEYAISQAFSESRAGDRYEARGRSMANDLADGLSPEMVERFRKGIIKLRGESGFYDKLYNRMEDIYGRVLPGYGPNGNDVRGALYFMIAPEVMLTSYGSYLKNIEENSELYLLYPRDYWLKFENKK